jgi:hypothetical protein
MSEIQEIIEKIALLEKEIASCEKQFEYHTEQAKLFQKKSNTLYEEQVELMEKQKILEMETITEEEKNTILAEIHKLKFILNSDVISSCSIYISKFELSTEDKMYLTSEKIEKYIKELLIVITRSEITDNGLSISVLIKTNRPVVKELIQNHINIPSEEDCDTNYFWSKEIYPERKIIK